METTINTYPTKDIDEHEKEHELDETTKFEDSSNSLRKRLGMSSRGVNSRQATRAQTNRVLRTTTGVGSQEYYRDIQAKLKKLQMPLWHCSATTELRDASPKHLMPKAQRFSSIEQDVRRNRMYLKLNLRQDIAGKNKGQSFPKSTRVDHFIDKSTVNNPSPANYRTRRFLQNSHYKTAKVGNASEHLDNQKSQSLEHKVNESQNNPENKEQELDVSPHYHNQEHLFGDEEEYRFDEIKGRTFYKFDKYHKQFLNHGKHYPYNDFLTGYVPGPGKYLSKDVAGRGKPCYSMRKILNRFNEAIKTTPGPSDYVNNPIWARPSTQKPTISSSLRMDLSKPLNTTPGPAFYSISRYLEKTNEFARQ